MRGCSPFQVSGLPHSDIPASSDICSYTGLFAACHVLPRLAAPRHPLWTLLRLTILFFSFPFPLKMLKILTLEAGGLEPPTPGLQSRCSSQLSYAPGLRCQPRMGRERVRAHLCRTSNLPADGHLCRAEAVRPSAPCLSYQKGGDPAAPSGTATLLRLHPPHQTYLRNRPPFGQAGDFGYLRLGWCDGRCVQGPGTYSPRHADARLLAIPTSCTRVAEYNPYWDRLSAVRSASRLRLALYRPL